MEWHYAENGKPVGPISDQDFTALVKQGKISSGTLVWHPGMETWTAYSELATATPQAAATQSATSNSSMKARCSECGKDFPANDMIQHGGDYVCAQCKPVYFQRLQEGVLSAQGNTPNNELMARGLAAVRMSWGPAIGVMFVFGLITIAVKIVPYLGDLVWFFIGGALELGTAIFFLSLSRGEPNNFGMLFAGFSRFWIAFLAALLRGLLIMLWAMPFIIGMIAMLALAGTKKESALLLIVGPLLIPLMIPLIMATYSYSLTFYIVADDASIGPYEAIVRSAKMMQGRRWKMFCLNMRFIGWTILSILTLFIGFLWLLPYMSTSMAQFYDDVKGRADSQA